MAGSETDLANVDYTLTPRIDGLQVMSDSAGAGGVFVTPPTNFRATNIASTSITLGWDKVTVGHAGFEIDLLVNGVFELLASVNPTVRLYVHSGLVSGTEYKYRLVAVDSSGNRSSRLIVIASTVGA